MLCSAFRSLLDLVAVARVVELDVVFLVLSFCDFVFLSVAWWPICVADVDRCCMLHLGSMVTVYEVVPGFESLPSVDELGDEAVAVFDLKSMVLLFSVGSLVGVVPGMAAYGAHEVIDVYVDDRCVCSGVVVDVVSCCRLTVGSDVVMSVVVSELSPMLFSGLSVLSVMPCLPVFVDCPRESDPEPGSINFVVISVDAVVVSCDYSDVDDLSLVHFDCSDGLSSVL